MRLSLLVAVLAGCSGDLQEKQGPSELDASPLQTITPPMCDTPATPSDGSGACTGGGNAGDDCLQCHHQGGGADAFTFAGTLYDTTGTTPLGGATIYVEDTAGNVATAVSHPGNGNFYATDGFVTYPAKAFVSLCPTVLAMESPVDEMTGANCNTSQCHTAGFRIHLP
ncbi:MAG TPA: hypothetical protein VLX92_09060 [Kofleriaceae bacterium]|nr:hypothetical protein [Kofleriaceae bacterium]